MSLVQQLAASKIIAIARGIPPELADRTAEALASGGIRFVEITMNSEAACETIARWRRLYDGSVRIGAGSVLNLELAEQAVHAGAEYLISPNLDEQVIAYGVRHHIDVWPGVMTPTEAYRAWSLGASAVKLFPASSLGAGFVKELQGPLPQIPIIATGGVGLDNIVDFLKAGAMAAGIGGSLVHKELIGQGQFDRLRELARQFAEAVQDRP